jgi:TPR repeat protein
MPSGGKLLHPETPTVGNVLGEGGEDAVCREPGVRGTPLVLDWSTQDRMDLEEAMHDGVAVVEYRCGKLRLIPGCRATGGYGFLGMSRREEVIQLTNVDEIRANLPLGGAAIAVDLGAELERGLALELAMVHSGKLRTTVSAVGRDRLEGQGCEAATHIVRGAFVGAFAMSSGTKGKVRTAAEVFSAGVSAGSSSAKQLERRDGDLSACGSVQPGMDRAPSQCSSVIRLELIALEAGAATPPASSPMPKELAAEMACPDGMVASEGKCTAEKAAPYRCSGSDQAECLEQCTRGDAQSCTIAAVLLDGTDRANELHEKACSRGVAYSCSRLGVAYFYGAGVAKDTSRAARLFLSACESGDADGCNNLGAVLDMGTGIQRDQTKAAELFVWSCNGGDAQGCFNALVSYRDGRGVRPDANRASTYLRRAEQGGLVQIFERGCAGGNAYTCWGLGYLHEHALLGKPRDLGAARSLYEKSCPGVSWGCESLAALKAKGR